VFLKKPQGITGDEVPRRLSVGFQTVLVVFFHGVIVLYQVFSAKTYAKIMQNVQ
jgi:hypothetical protein